MNHRSVGKSFFIYIGLAATMLFIAFPFFWLVSSSLKGSQEIFAIHQTLIPKQITFLNFSYAFSSSPGPDIGPLLTNSISISLFTALITLFFAATGGYAVGRLNFPGLQAFILLIMITQMFQGPVIMVPWYKMAANMNLLNTKTGLVLIYLTSTIPIAVWLMSGFFKGLPKEMEEAATIDGCGKMRTFLQIILPLVKGGLVSVGIYAFILAWNDYQYALILTTSEQAKTVQVGIAELMGGIGKINWGGIMACGVIITIPVVLLFGFVQRYLIEGLTAGAVKG